MRFFDAIGFGALNVDKLFKVNKIAKEDEESFIIDFQETCGGSAANAMVGLSRLGCNVGFIGKIACDREGEMLIRNFCMEGVDTKSIICIEKGRSGTVMGFIDEKGERALYVDAGVNDIISLKEVDTEYAFQASFLHITSFVGEVSFKTQKELLEILPEKVKVSFDPGMLYARMGWGKLEQIIKKTYLLMLTPEELKLLTGKTNYRKGAEFLIGKGVEIVAVKIGEKGCYVTDGKERHVIQAFKTRVIDTTGAGDAFCAGFLYGLIAGKNLYECGRLSNFVASRCIMKIGARSGLPHNEDLKLLR